MKLYAKELITVTTPSENIIALDALRRKYGNPQRDEQGSYWEVDHEVVHLLPRGVTFEVLQQQRQGQEEG